jgi:hypothetical protein
MRPARYYKTFAADRVELFLRSVAFPSPAEWARGFAPRRKDGPREYWARGVAEPCRMPGYGSRGSPTVIVTRSL